MLVKKKKCVRSRYCSKNRRLIKCRFDQLSISAHIEFMSIYLVKLLLIDWQTRLGGNIISGEQLSFESVSKVIIQ